MTSTEFYELAEKFEPESMEGRGAEVPEFVRPRLEDVAREEYRLYLEDEAAAIAEYYHSGIDVARDFDGLRGMDRARLLRNMADFAAVLLSNGYILIPLPAEDIWTSERDVDCAVRDMAAALHGSWARGLKDMGAVMGPDVFTRDGRIVMHPDLIPFENLGFYDPDETRADVSERARRWRDEKQAPFLKKSRRALKAFLTAFVLKSTVRRP